MKSLNNYITEGFKNINKLALFQNDESTVFGIYDTISMERAMADYDYKLVEESVYGAVEIRYNKKLDCNEIESIYAIKGYGPIMYMIAMQFSPKGLVPNRTSQVSKSAKNVWKNFYDGKGSSSVNYKPIEGNHSEIYLNQKYNISKSLNLSKSIRLNKEFLKNDIYKERYYELNEAIDGKLRDEMRNIYESLLTESFQIFETRDGDNILVPRFKPSKQTHRLFKDWPIGKNFGFNQSLIYDAIQWGMILEMIYDKDGVKTKRLIQPMVLGRNAEDDLLLRAFHLKGDSKSLGPSTKKVWRLFKPKNIEELSFTGRFFRTSEDNYNPNDSAMVGGIITSADIDSIRNNQMSLAD